MPAAAFQLDPRLAADTVPVGALQLCLVTLRNDARFPWVILIPQCEGASEIVDLDESDRQHLMQEVAQVSEALRDIYKPDKLNVASLGNIVPQLHVHVIARFKADAAWPHPVWGMGEAKTYNAQARGETIEKLHEALKL